jgi:hypothetical protein
MIIEPTVFIIGAGASRPYGFPSGKELFDNISEGKCSLPATEDPDFDQIQNNSVQHFIGELRGSGHESVDAFLENRTDLVDIGKRLIASALIPFEDEQLLFEQKANQERGAQWYKYLLRAMMVDAPDLLYNKVSFITFNYDRSIEHFFTKALAANTGISLLAAWDKIQYIQIVHLHGMLGPYHPDAYNGRAYEPNVTLRSVQMAAASIKIINESSDDSKEYAQARRLLEQAQRYIFLGFGFHPTTFGGFNCARSLALDLSMQPHLGSLNSNKDE